MGLDKLGPHHKQESTEDVGDSTLSVEFESIAVLRDIFQELKIMNAYFALMTDEPSPPDRDTINDSTNLP